MQISASNLLLAAQQAQGQVPHQKTGVASFAAALKPDQAQAAKPGFDALPLKKIAAPGAPDPVTQDLTKPAGAGAATRPGANLDIRI